KKRSIDFFNIHMFNLKKTNKLLDIHRTLFVDDIPVVLEITIIPEFFVPSLSANDVKKNVFSEVFKNHGVVLKKTKKLIQPQLADSYVGGKLGVDTGVPILEIER